jgi:hypothetical protein
MSDQLNEQDLEARGFIPRNASPGLKKELAGAIAPFSKAIASGAFRMTEVDKHIPGVYRLEETPENKVLRHNMMKATLRDRFGAERLKSAAEFKKGFIGVSSNITPYDLQAPAKQLVPWLYPLREALPRVARVSPGATAHWKSFTTAAGSYSRGTLPAMPWVNEGQRAPQLSLTALNASATYTTIGREGSVSFEAEAASVGFDDAMALEHFFTLETVMAMEEDSLLGGNNSLALGTTNTPAGSSTGSASLTGNFWAWCVALTYEGYRNFILRNGFSSSGVPLVTSGLEAQQQVSVVTPDGKTMTTNGGCAQHSVVSSELSPSSAASAKFTVTPKSGEVAYLWYISTADNTAATAHLCALTTVPVFSFTSDPTVGNTGNETVSALTAADFSQNNGSAGGQSNQVTAFDGLLTQAWNNTNLSPQNAYVNNLAGAFLTTAGKGNVNEIDALLMQMWNLYKVTVDVIWCNAQELANITSRVLNGSSAPLLRAMTDSDGFDLTGYGVISFYHNPYIPGGRKIPIMIHPTIPPGTLLAYAKSLPAYYKSSSTPNVAEVLTRRDYYAQEWPITTREYQYGVYSEEVLALYAPFSVGILTGIGNG